MKGIVMSEKLKPCPFCGGEAESSAGNGKPRVRCKNDGYEDKFYNYCPASHGWSSEKVWNFRTPP